MISWKKWIRPPLNSGFGDERVSGIQCFVGWVRRRFPQTSGAIEYMLDPNRGVAWGGPFNGQRFRQELVQNLIEKFAPVAILETGTYLGTTTDFLAATGIPIFSVESNPRSYGFAKARIRGQWNVHLLCGGRRPARR